VISGGITLNKVHVEQGAIAGVANAGSNESRTHLALKKDAPVTRPVAPASAGRIVVTP